MRSTHGSFSNPIYLSIKPNRLFIDKYLTQIYCTYFGGFQKSWESNLFPRILENSKKKFSKITAYESAKQFGLIGGSVHWIRRPQEWGNQNAIFALNILVPAVIKQSHKIYLFLSVEINIINQFFFNSLLSEITWELVRATRLALLLHILRAFKITHVYNNPQEQLYNAISRVWLFHFFKRDRK